MDQLLFIDQLSINESAKGIEQAIHEVCVQLRGGKTFLTLEEALMGILYRRLTCDENASAYQLGKFRCLIDRIKRSSADRKQWNIVVVDNPEGLDEALYNLLTAVKDLKGAPVLLEHTECVTQWIRGRIKHDK